MRLLDVLLERPQPAVVGATFACLGFLLPRRAVQSFANRDRDRTQSRYELEHDDGGRVPEGPESRRGGGDEPALQRLAKGGIVQDVADVGLEDELFEELVEGAAELFEGFGFGDEGVSSLRCLPGNGSA